MQTIDLSLNRKATFYQILIGAGLLTQPIETLENKIYSNIAIVSNETVANHYLGPLIETIRNSGFSGHIETILIGDGENYKSFESFNHVMDKLISKQFRRNDLLIALGGGVVGDLTGFSAACYQRGMDFMQIPTSLLAMVDSSVGGKTAINHSQGKNLVGAFHQPVEVRIDPNCLKTLAPKQFNAGMAEIIKIAAIYDAQFFDWIEQNIDNIKAQNTATLEQLIFTSCCLKAKVVSQDETEQGVRAILNFGHTFGHAIESVLGFGKILHGEAVAIGMVMATQFSAKQNLINNDFSERLEKLLSAFNLPTKLSTEIKAKDLIYYMSLDKKNQNSDIRLILLSKLGNAIIKEYPLETVKVFLASYE